MVRPLIPDRILKQIETIAVRSKRSSCRIGRRTWVDDGRGASYLSDPVFDSPVICRVDPPTTPRETIRGEQITPVSGTTIALPLETIPPGKEDIIEVTTPGIDGGPERFEMYNVLGTPLEGTSYAVEVTVAVQKIGE